MLGAAILLAGALVGTQGGEDVALPSLTVSALLARLHDLDGREVEVRGWLSGCHAGFNCTLLPRPVHLPGQPPGLTIGFVKAIEPALGAKDGREVVIRGRVTDECRSGRSICTDRAPDIIPLAVSTR